MALNTHFDELLEFPCMISFKIMGVNDPKIIPQVIEDIQKLAPGDYSPRTKASSKGNYCAMSLPVTVTSKDHMESIYNDLNKIDLVRHVI